jgi:hypothetical protein
MAAAVVEVIAFFAVVGTAAAIVVVVVVTMGLGVGLHMLMFGVVLLGVRRSAACSACGLLMNCLGIRRQALGSLLFQTLRMSRVTPLSALNCGRERAALERLDPLQRRWRAHTLLILRVTC